MPQFDEREKASERHFELEEEKNFRVVSSATKDLGIWAAEKMGMDGEGKKAYSSAILEADLQKPHHERLLGKVLEDFVSKGIRVSPRDIAQKYEQLLAHYRKQMQEAEKA